MIQHLQLPQLVPLHSWLIQMTLAEEQMVSSYVTVLAPLASTAVSVYTSVQPQVRAMCRYKH
eukprot:4687-Heterococcus_DN1.PRE.4